MSKNDKIKVLWDKGLREPVAIAKKLGYKGGALSSGIEKVKAGLRELGLVS